MQPEEHQDLIGLERMRACAGDLDVDPAQRAFAHDQRFRQALEIPHPPGRHQIAHLRYRGRRRFEFRTAVH